MLAFKQRSPSFCKLTGLEEGSNEGEVTGVALIAAVVIKRMPLLMRGLRFFVRSVPHVTMHQ